MKVIGVTGGIGSGKSAVSQFLAELGAIIVDADKVGHEVFKPDTEAWHEVVATFGRQIVTPSGSIDRKRLGEIVFNKPEPLLRLNQIMHPRMYNMVKAQLEEYRWQGTVVAVVDAALLIEAGWIPLVDEVWVIVTSESAVLRRLQQRTGLSPAESLARIRSQLSSEERIKHADVVINNDFSLDELKARVGELWWGLELDASL